MLQTNPCYYLQKQVRSTQEILQATVGSKNKEVPSIKLQNSVPQDAAEAKRIKEFKEELRQVRGG